MAPRSDAARAPTVNIDHNTLKNVDIEARLDDADRRDRVRQVITDAFFDDLSTFDVGDRRVVVIFDTYEQASAVVQQWLSGMFLARVRNHLRLVLVVAGREIPELDTDAHDWCLRHELMPLDHDMSRSLCAVWSSSSRTRSFASCTRGVADGHSSSRRSSNGSSARVDRMDDDLLRRLAASTDRSEALWLTTAHSLAALPAEVHDSASVLQSCTGSTGRSSLLSMAPER